MLDEKCEWCNEGFEYNEPRANREGKMVFHIVNKKGEHCVEEYRLELKRVLQEEQRRRSAFEKME